jgi:ADP-heptose:LPS heptosyltransferase
LGLGDIVEYALAVEAIKKANIFPEIGIAFVGRYEEIFKKYFTIRNLYPEVISEEVYRSFKTIFHTTLEIPTFKNQKFIRSDIEKNLINFFKVKKLRNHKNKNQKKIKKLTIFPISNSSMRIMPIVLLERIIEVFSKNYFVEIILDTNSLLSNYFEKKLINSNASKIYPKNLEALLSVIESIDFGVFMDSGPLHIAKILNINGILIENSVSSKILLNDFNSIKSFKNTYQSKFCKAPCGLTNIFNYDNNYGCFDSLQINKLDFDKINNLNSLQRGSPVKYNEKFIDNPVSCLKNINSLMLINFLEGILK